LYTHSVDFFQQYHGDWHNLQTSKPDTTKPLRGYSMAMNYCWHHSSASLYLCPYGYEINYVNHNQSLANVRLQWTADGIMNQKVELLEQSPAAMIDQPSPGLSMDFVATREIAVGDELFLDYGDDWEQAWQQHVQAFEHPSAEQRRASQANYISARQWNARHVNAILRTKSEQAIQPYPNNLQLHCLDEEDAVLDSDAAAALWTIDNSGSRCDIASRRVDDDGTVFYKVWLETDEEEDEVVASKPTTTTKRAWHESGWIVREAIQ
jgi:hypothetical protein